MPLIDTANGPIWYADHRDPTVHRAPLLLVHGAGGSHLDWSAELRRLPEGNVLAPDLPGHNKSAGPSRASISAYAADMVALLDALRVEKAIVGGHSMGGAIAQMMALNDPQRVAGLVLIGTGAKLSVSPDILNNVRQNTTQALDLINQWEWGENASEQIRRLSRKRLEENDPQTLYNDYYACNNFDVRDQLGRISAPALIIGGSVDQMTPFKFSVYLHERIAGSKLVKIEGGGHKMVLEQPQAVADAVQNWLNEVNL